MKDFTHFGIKQRNFPEYNYNAIWQNLKTVRLGQGVAQELPPTCSEFYDVSLGTKCNLECPFCYTNALHTGVFYKDVCEKAKMFFGEMDENSKPFQIAIGSEGEPTIHPEFISFLQTIYDLGIVPNYTTNGITLASEDNKELLEATEKYCGGVAVSANTWNENINKTWKKAVDNLKGIDININIHYIISDKASIDKFVSEVYPYVNDILYFVLLPLMPSGRSVCKYTQEAFEYLLSKDLNWSKIAFGAHFYDLLKQQDKIKCWLYPPESFSKNLILGNPIKITKSSFHKEPIWQKDV